MLFRSRPPHRKVRHLFPEIGASILIDRYHIQIGQADTYFGQAVAYRLRREARPVLDAPEAFLLGSGNQYAILDEASGRVAVVGV